ncbi:MAG: hypothetical protein JO147_08745, partial [Actinobacteria bacterium]|nr:hypothetical protein [Actinomycetota bacterium]
MYRAVRHTRSRQVVLIAGLLLLVIAPLLVRSTVSSGPATADTTSPTIPGVPSVTGQDTPNGYVTISALRDEAGGAIVEARAQVYDGLDRGYVTVVPQDVTTPIPLIVVLHGINASPTQEIERDEFLPLVAAGKAALLYPAGYDQSWNTADGNCCGAA